MYLKFVESVRFDDRFNSIMNDLVVIAPDKFYITSYLPKPADPKTGRDMSILEKVKGVFTLLFSKSTGVHLCTNNNGTAVCEEYVAQCGMCNGISTDGEELFVTDLVTK
jgi:hypothetical protein